MNNKIPLSLLIKNLFNKSRFTINDQILKTFLIKNYSPQSYRMNSIQPNKMLFSLNFKSYFSSQKKDQQQIVKLKKQPLKAEQIPAQNLQIVQTQQNLLNQDIQVTHAKGTLSILDKVPGAKTQSTGDLYVLMFRCGQCNHQQIRSFTKNAYHKGVVLVRCQGCDKVHLVADNLGWFQDQPVNVQTLHKDKIKKVNDPAAISMFLKKAFQQEDKLLNQNDKKQDKKQEIKHQ